MKDELRRNLIRKLKAGEELFPGIVGYRDSVLRRSSTACSPSTTCSSSASAGQAKTRLLRMLPLLLDEYIPVIAGTEINDDPLAPITKTGKRLISEHGDDTPPSSGSTATTATRKSSPHRT